MDAVVRGWVLAGILALGWTADSPGVAQAVKGASTLARVRAAGELACGIDAEEPEYSTADDHGSREGFDKDLCEAVAVAVLGEHARVRVVNYPDDEASMEALRAGEVDMVPTLSDDFTHAVGTHLRFTRPVLWDGVGFLLLGAGPAVTVRQLSGKKICFLAETGVEESVRAWFAREHLDFVAFPFQEEGEMEAAFATGNCGALAGDRTRLAGTRALMAEHGKRTRLLAQTISKEPLAVAVREDDAQWAAVVNWVAEALVEAEEKGVTRANVASIRAAVEKGNDAEPAVRFLMGGSRQVGSGLGLQDDWVVRVIQATGNYGEMFERDLGTGSALKLPRGDNALWERGGLMVALPAK